MGTRQQLQDKLKTLPGIKDVWYQKPSGPLNYPAIVYKKGNTFKRHASNDPYMIKYQYELIVMDKDPDSPLFEAVEMLPECTFIRAYGGDQVNHQVFEIYF